MLRIVLVLPGSTDFDEQGRIQGTLEIPLSQLGTKQVAETVEQLLDLPLEIVYTSPCQSAEQTAEALANAVGTKVKRLEKLCNLDQGLWQGKLVEEVRQKQPKVYRQWQEHPETICPPEGETLSSALRRVEALLAKVFKKHKNGVIALVAPEPLASLIRSQLSRSELGNLWKNESPCGSWKMYEIELETAAQSS